MWTHARIRSWNQQVLSNKGKLSCSWQQRLEPTTSTLRVRRAMHCATPRETVTILYEMEWCWVSPIHLIYKYTCLIQDYCNIHLNNLKGVRAECSATRVCFNQFLSFSKAKKVFELIVIYVRNVYVLLFLLNPITRYVTNNSLYIYSNCQLASYASFTTSCFPLEITLVSLNFKLNYVMLPLSDEKLDSL